MRAKELVSIGLSEKEAAVYLALLELGSDTVQNIAKKSGVNRATTYVILDSLKKKGVASTVEKGTKTHFQAESPDSLRKLIRLQEAEVKEYDSKLNDMLPELKGLFNLAENKPVVRFFEGERGIRQIVEDIFRMENGVVYNAYNADVLLDIFTQDEVTKNFELRLKRKVQTINIFTSKTATYRPHGKFGEWYQVPEELFPFPGDITIYGNRVALSSLKNSLSGVIIESAAIAQTMRSLFLLAVEAARAKKK